MLLGMHGGREAKAFIMVCRGIESKYTAGLLRRREADLDARYCGREDGGVPDEEPEVAEGSGRALSSVLACN